MRFSQFFARKNANFALFCTVLLKKFNFSRYLCKNYAVDTITQQSVTCAADNSIQVMCETAEHIKCVGKDQFGIFNRTVRIFWPEK